MNSQNFDQGAVEPVSSDPKVQDEKHRCLNVAEVFHSPYHPWDWHIYLHEWLIFMVNVGKIPCMDGVGNEKTREDLQQRYLS